MSSPDKINLYRFRETFKIPAANIRSIISRLKMEVIKERNELLEYQPDNNQEILDIIEKTSNCILRRNNFMIATGLLWTSYTSSYQIMSCLRYILEKTLENLP